MTEAKSPRGPKFQRRAEARPDEVLDAAIELFMEKGFAATRVEEIARRAGLSKGTVYLYFPSKEAVLEGLVRRAILPVAESALGALDAHQGDPRIVITQVIRMLADRLSDPKTMAIPQIVLREVLGFPHLAQMYRREVLDRAIPALENLIRRGIDQGYLRPVDPELTVRSVIGPIMIHMVLAEVFEVTPQGGLQIDRLIDNHLAILFSGLSAPGAQQG